MTNQSFTTPCGKTYYVGQVFCTADDMGNLPDGTRVKKFTHFDIPTRWCFEITSLPPQPEPATERGKAPGWKW